MLRTDVPYVDQSGRLTQAGFQALQGASALGDLSDVVLTTPATGNLLTYNGTAWVNSAPAASGTDLLGSITTTSGSSQSLSSLTLTPYKFVRLVIDRVSGSLANWGVLIDGVQATVQTFTAVQTIIGFVDIDLTDGAFIASATNPGATSNVAVTYVGTTSITTATTTITASINVGAFDNGGIRVFGMR